MRRHIAALGLLLPLLATQGQAGAGEPPPPQSTLKPDEGAACGGKPLHFQLADVRGRLYSGVASVSRRPIVLAYYSGYKSAPVHEGLRDQLLRDPQLGTGGALRDTWAGFAIVDYKEGWFVPGWAVDKALREKMAKYPSAIFLADRGECLTQSGTSNKCPGKDRRPYFRSNQGSVAVLYHGLILHQFAGPTSAAGFLGKLRRLAEQARAEASFCQAKQAVAW